MSILLFIIAALVASAGAILCAYSKTGEQETLGGVLVMLGIVAAMLGGACWSIGL